MFVPTPPAEENHGAAQPQAGQEAHEERPLTPNELYLYAADCLHNGSTPEEIRKQLVALGYNGRQVLDAVSRAQRQQASYVPQHAAAGGQVGQRNMVIGGLVALAGIVITLLTLQTGNGIIAWGAIVFGGLQFFRGVAQSGRGE